MASVDTSAPRSGTETTRWSARIVVVLSVAALAFEQSPANEAVRANLAFRVLDHTGNALAVGAVVLVITLAIEGIPGALIAYGLHLNPGLERRLMRRSHQTPDEAPKTGRGGFGSILTDVGIALGVGAGLVVVRRRWADPRRSLADDLRTCAWACAVVAVVSGVIGFLVAGGIRYADAVGLERPAQLVVDYATDWRFWLVLVIVIQGGSWIAGHLGTRSRPDSDRAVEAETCARAEEVPPTNAEATCATNHDASRRPDRPRRDRPLRAAGRPGP